MHGLKMVPLEPKDIEVRLYYEDILHLVVALGGNTRRMLFSSKDSDRTLIERVF